MIVKIAIILVCVLAVILTFKGEWVLKRVFKIPEPSEKAVLNVKFIALGIAILLFAAVFRV